MDPSQFDELVAKISNALTRRDAVKGLSGGALTSAGIGSILAESADAAKKKGRGNGENRKGRNGKNHTDRSNSGKDSSRAESGSEFESENK